jgi:hypothetical protein
MKHKWWFLIGATAALLILVGVTGVSLAQMPGGDLALKPAALYSKTWTFSYQGRLLDGGAPANGRYDFAVDVYSNPMTPGSLVATCIDVGPGLSDYQVNDGLFTFYLLCNGNNSTVFTGGSERWIEVQVAPHGTGITTTLQRQPIAPVPYAFSLFPGATISGTATFTTHVLLITGTVASDSAVLRVNTTGDGVAIRGYNMSDIGVRGDGGYAGVFGYSSGSSGVYGLSQSGVAIRGDSPNGNLLELYDASPPTNLRFKVDNAGEVYADGGYHCGKASSCWYTSDPADLAEVLPAANDPEPGDVLVADPEGSLVRSAEPYQTSVMGVYSTRPMYIGNGKNLDQEGYAPLAIVGVVPVKVSTENGAIHPGDLLTTSSTPGHAMRADHFVGGAIIGKALGTWEKGTGVIQMLVTLQ